MSTHRKVDPDAGARFLMDLLAEDDAERLDTMSDEESIAERKAKGREVLPAPSAEALIAKLRARAKRQAASGPDGRRVASAADADAPVERLAPRRRARASLWLLAAAIVMLLVVVAKGPAIVAYFRQNVHEPIGPEPPLQAQEIAGKLRHDAIGLCAQGAWATCRDNLDEAQRLDPAGESDPQVLQLREDIDAAEHPREEPKKKPEP